MIKNNKLLYAAIILSILSFISAYYNHQQFKGHINESMVNVNINQDIKLKDIANNEVIAVQNLGSGQYYIVSFIASWCALCEKQYKMLSKIRSLHNIPLYAVIWQDYPENIFHYISSHHYKYDRIFQDITGKLTTFFKIYALPTVALVGPNHQVKFLATGVINEQIIEKYITPVVSNTHKQ